MRESHEYDSYAMAWGRTVALYGKGILDIPMNSLVEEFKCAKTSLEMNFSQSKDPEVKNTASMV